MAYLELLVMMISPLCFDYKQIDGKQIPLDLYPLGQREARYLEYDLKLQFTDAAIEY